MTKQVYVCTARSPRIVMNLVDINEKSQIPSITHVIRKGNNRGQYKTLVLCNKCGHYSIDRRKIVKFPQRCLHCLERVYYTHGSVAIEHKLLPTVFTKPNDSKSVLYKVIAGREG